MEISPSLHACWIPAQQLVFQPWKNGGGKTRQIALWPPGASADDFTWRLSAADVTGNGPFSAWPGIDRTLLLSSGGPLVLTHPANKTPICLSIDTPPFRFDGETTYEATLQGGPVRDFNLMLRRGQVYSQVDRLDTPFMLKATRGHTLLHVLHGRFHLEGPGVAGLTTTTLGESDTLWLADLTQMAIEKDKQHTWRHITLPEAGLQVKPIGPAALARVTISDDPGRDPDPEQGR